MVEHLRAVDLSPASDAAEVTALFSGDAFRRGHCHITKGDRPGETVYLPSPQFRDRPDIRGRYGPEHGFHLPGDTDVAAISAEEFARYVDAGDLRFHLNVIDRRTSGAVTRASVVGARGLAVQTPYRPEIDKGDDDKTPLSLNLIRIVAAKVRAMYFLGFSQRESWVFMPFAATEDLSGDVRRQQLYCDTAHRLAEAVGGKAALDPLLTTLPLPGACPIGRTSYRVNRCVTPADIGLFDRPFARGLDDAVEAVARIEAAPRIALDR